jgi:hypothetical protein
MDRREEAGRWPRRHKAGGERFARFPRWARGSAVTPISIVSYASGTVTPITTATNTAGRPIKVGNGAFAIAITP